MAKKEELTCRGCGQTIKKKDSTEEYQGELYHTRCAPKPETKPVKGWLWHPGDGPMPI